MQPCYHSGVDFPSFTKTFQSNLLPYGVYNENAGFPEIARRLRAIAKAEGHHGERHKKSLKEVEGAQYLRKTGKTAGSAGDAAISM